MNGLMNYLVNLGPWNWLILSVVLFILETMVPGVHFVWFGMAATVVGVIALNFEMAWQLQLVIFGVLSFATVFVVQHYFDFYGSKSDQPELNERGQYYLGRIVTVEDAIVSGRGRIRVGDSLWSAQGPDMPAGSQAKVVGVNGTVLVVDALS